MAFEFKEASDRADLVGYPGGATADAKLIRFIEAGDPSGRQGSEVQAMLVVSIQTIVVEIDVDDVSEWHLVHVRQ